MESTIDTNLWAVIDNMQRNLERRGVNSEVADAAIARRLVRLLLSGGKRRAPAVLAPECP